MAFEPGVTKVRSVAVEDIRATVDAPGAALVLLSSTGIVDRVSFFEAARDVLPLDPPVASNRSWNALGDSLELRLVLDVLGEVARQLADRDATVGRPEVLCVLVEMDERT